MTEPWLETPAIAQVQLILDSYRHWFEAELISREGTPIEQAQRLFEAPMAVFSHGTEADPIYNYGSAQGLALWERSWAELTAMPSRQSAAESESEQQERYQVLTDSRNLGYKQDFSGTRITKSGRVVHIENFKLWDLLDTSGQYRGQAAVFSKWTFLDS